jgi:hypothetical protein
MDFLLAGSPFESLTALREIGGAARPTRTLRRELFVGSATVPIIRRWGGLSPDFTSSRVGVCPGDSFEGFSRKGRRRNLDAVGLPAEEKLLFH